MEFNQLEYYVTSVETRSFYKAAQKLFVSQPAISKAIKALEQEIGQILLERTSRGLKVTAEGERFYHNAKQVLRQLSIMKAPLPTKDELLAVASYPSNLIAGFIADFYVQNKVDINFLEGGVQDIIDNVSEGVCEIGMVYISPNQRSSFEHILHHKHLEFIPLADREICVYVGEKHKLFGAERAISLQEMGELSYFRGLRDFFSVEHHFDYVSLNALNFKNFNERIISNSDHLTMQLLKKTDLAYLSIDTKGTANKYKLELEAEEKNVVLGYIKVQDTILTDVTQKFLAFLKKKEGINKEYISSYNL